MSETTINIESVKIALDRVRGNQFENFVNAYYPSLEGIEFTPLGGTGDGGADAIKTSGLWEQKSTGVFYQASVEKDHRAKIQKTVKRLREFKRIVKTLYYLTNREISHIDREEDELSEKHDVRIKIRDKKYIVSHITDTYGTRAAFETYLRPELEFLKYIGKTSIITPTKSEASPAIFVFLSQEIARREGKNESLINSIADGLILWALEGTDPDKENLLSEKQIVEKIKENVPSAAKIIMSAVPGALTRLRSKPRLIRYYRKQDVYCLTYEFRKRVEADNIRDEALRINVKDKFFERLSSFGLSVKDIDLCVDASLTVLQRIFETEGIEFVDFIKNERAKVNPIPTIADLVDDYFEEQGVKPADWTHLKESVIKNLQRAIYNSSQVERVYFSRSSETYTLLFCLNTEPHIVEYFNKMAANFQLYVGADLIVRAFSERYLHSEDRQTVNTLRIIHSAGGKLILTEPVLDEVYGHLKHADSNFRDIYQKIEPSITLQIAQNFPEILIRAYFYAKLSKTEGITAPTNWGQFIDQFCDYSKLGAHSGKEALRRYLISNFNMKYEDKEDLEKITDQSKVKKLAKKLFSEKRIEKLAERDALMPFAIYAKRRANREHSTVSSLGYKTWWLTEETVILKYTKDLIRDSGAKYIMNPEFLLRFLSLAPSGSEVKKTYRNIFPSILGIRLAHRIEPKTLNEVLRKLEDAQNLEPSARQAKISMLSDELKTKYFSKENEK